jgi:hypothetical protein
MDSAFIFRAPPFNTANHSQAGVSVPIRTATG